MQDHKAGIIGSGGVAQALGSGFAAKGWDVMLGTRDAAKLSDWKTKTGARARVGTFAQAASFGDVVVLAVKGAVAEDAVKLAGPQNLKGKTVLDACNPIADAPPTGGVLKYFTGPNESLLERLQTLAPEARFVKAFSCVGSALMVDPKLPGGKPTMFICGASAEAKMETQKILESFGWEHADMGGPEAARAIEPLAMLWCIPGFKENDWMHAFKLLRQ